MRTVNEHRQFLQALASRAENPEAGFFGPGSMAWRINRETVLSLVVLRALFMQIAHPKVAQGVADHSDFVDKPFQRAYATFKAQQRIVFGSCEESTEALMRIYARHVGVVGQVEGVALGIRDSSYEANDPSLLFWVFATLFDSMLYAYRTFMPKLSSSDSACFYREGKLFARLIGVSDDKMPATLADFDAWMHNELASNKITVTDAGRRIAAALLRMPFGIVRPFNEFLAAVTLPECLREQFDLRWTVRRAQLFLLLSRWLRFVLAHTPVVLRSWPVYWIAVQRARSATVS
ncbi:MAG: oxygenase MpaB family protein [Anaerolineales bacterium]